MKNIAAIIAVSAYITLFMPGFFLPEASAVFYNQPPVWTQAPSQTAYKGQTLTFTVSANDPDDDILDYSASGLPPGAIFNGFTGTFSWTHNSSQSHTYTVKFRAFDGIHVTDMWVTVYAVGYPYPTQNPVQPSPQPPFFPPQAAFQFVNFNPPLVATEGALYSYAVLATGGSGAISYSLVSAPTGMTMHPTSGLISWIPTFSQSENAPYVVTVRASSGAGVITENYLLSVQNASQGTVPPPNPPPPPPPASGGNVLKLSASGISATIQNGDAVITWQTNKAATGYVMYGKTSEAEKTGTFTYDEATDETSDLQTAHEVTLEDLDENTTYYFRIVSKTGSETHISEEHSFKTSSSEGLAGIFGTLGGLPVSTWIFIIVSTVLAVLLYLGYRKNQMVVDH